MVTLYPLNHEAFNWALSAFCQLNRGPFSAFGHKEESWPKRAMVGGGCNPIKAHQIGNVGLKEDLR